MFTGLVEDVGTVARADRRSDALALAIRPERIPLGELTVGDSICHDGACLTVTELGREAFTVLAGAETLARTTLGGLRAGARANLVLVVRAAPALLRYVVEKGSIALAGVSLTVNAVDGESFSVAIIPHTRD